KPAWKQENALPIEPSGSGGSSFEVLGMSLKGLLVTQFTSSSLRRARKVHVVSALLLSDLAGVVRSPNFGSTYASASGELLVYRKIRWPFPGQFKASAMCSSYQASRTETERSFFMMLTTTHITPGVGTTE